MTQAHASAQAASTCREILRAACTIAIAVMLGSCSPSFHRDAPSIEDAGTALRYSIVCVIHGDGDYLYHDSAGSEQMADEHALAGAVQMAERNPLAEVFVLHEKAQGGFLSLFGGHDGEFSYYRRGRLIAREPYSRTDGPSRFETQAELCRRFRAVQPSPVTTFFLYFGHELSELDTEEGEGESPFTVDELSNGVKLLTGDSARVDLLVLSSCFNGTPHAIASLAPRARIIIASPDNLHLSYFDIRPLEHLETGVPDGDVSSFASEFAHRAFDELTRSVQTSVTVAVYDADRVQGFLRAVDSIERTLPASPARAIEWCDCADLPAYHLQEMSEGVEVLYRPARFGRSKNRMTHSGWECRREVVPPAIDQQPIRDSPR